MAYLLYDHIDAAGRNVFKIWFGSQEKTDRAKINMKLDLLQTVGTELPPKLLSHSGSPHILKLRLIGKGKIQLRPMLCKGPVNNDQEFTLLRGAIEKGFKLQPPDADDDAEKIRQEVKLNPVTRRCIHERTT